ncbi:alkaline phosphatase D family protein [Verrucomicrobium sp. BvORR106]|uniref:alkaline phosphatase D family protein n=1 Tax=Verrucomicrobium sp. BvORR106 TaxID=1403819 RepID=UPI0009E04B1C|nr:alkaline phosphatase D family protein [Verrucomicrobium sp. BvORR106]
MKSSSRSSGRVSRRQFVAGTLACTAASALNQAAAAPAVSSDVLGPIVGHTESDKSALWMRVAAPGEYVLEVTPSTGGAAIKVPAQATAEHDFCLHWQVEGLRPGTSYRYRVTSKGTPLADAAEQTFKTAPDPAKPGKVRFAISSCAKEDAGSRAVWTRMAEEQVDAVILIGDTPYIDSTKLDIQTKRHREFAAVTEYQKLLQSRPCWWTWDDHDFAGNDCDGRAAGKENSRTVYCRYRPQWSFGEDNQGIYTSFRHGPVEVFLLDTRWFSETEKSYADPSKPSLLGAAQWEWLQRGLKASTAPFKLLACGVIWDDKQSREKDDWGTYMHERKALEDFIARNKIPGVVLVGGDIHASRVLRYKSKKTVGYDLVQFIASPIHSSVIPKLNTYHPNLVRSAVEPHVFLVMEVDSTVSPARISAELVNRHGERVFTYNLTLADLTPA